MICAWGRIRCGQNIHVVPINDWRDHKEVGCWCHPTAHEHETGDLIEHRSMDRREMYESGELRVH